MKLAVRGVCVVGIGLGVGSVVIARSEPEASLAGTSVAAQVALVGTGWALLGCGLVASTRRPASRFGMLVALAGCAWLLVEFNNPGGGSALAFTVGLVDARPAPSSGPRGAPAVSPGFTLGFAGGLEGFLRS